MLRQGFFLNTMEKLLSVNGVYKVYTNHTALENVSLNIPKGKIYGLLGPNGAGKTSLIRLITQITAPDKGAILFNGEKLTPKHIGQMGYLPEERGLYKKMKVGEQAIYLARLKGLSEKDARKALKEWFEKLGMETWWNKKVEELSKGMAQKIQFVTTVMHKPPLLILDEPFSGFDPVNANLIKQEILALKESGTTILLSTHNMASVEEICDEITLINKAQNVLSGSVKQLKEDYAEKKYQIRLQNNISKLANFISENNLGHQSKLSEKNQELECIIAPTISVNDFLTQVMTQFTLRNFQEILPTMDEIFIKTVKG